MEVKVKKEVVVSELINLVYQAIDSMPTPIHKFLIGGAIGYLQKNDSTIGQLLSSITDQDNLVDVSQLRQISDNAFKASGGDLKITLFNSRESILGSLIQPVTLTISKDDIDRSLNKISESSNAIPQVQLS